MGDLVVCKMAERCRGGVDPVFLKKKEGFFVLLENNCIQMNTWVFLHGPSGL